MTNSSNPVLKTDTDDQTTVMAHAGGDQMKISEMTEREAAFDQFQYKRRLIKVNSVTHSGQRS